MSIDHINTSFTQDGIPLNQCYDDYGNCDCGAKITDDNAVKRCQGCGFDGCEKCLVQDENYMEYFCPDEKNKKEVSKGCYIEFLGKVIDKCRLDLRRWMLNNPQEVK
jgi:hypothetical protein